VKTEITSLKNVIFEQEKSMKQEVDRLI